VVWPVGDLAASLAKEAAIRSVDTAAQAQPGSPLTGEPGNVALVSPVD